MSQMFPNQQCEICGEYNAGYSDLFDKFLCQNCYMNEIEERREEDVVDSSIM